MKHILTTTAAAFFASGIANSAITIDSTIVGNERLTFGAQVHTIATSLDASGSDKLVVAVATEHNFGGTSKPAVPSITFGGTALDLAGSEVSTQSGRVSVLYIDNPGVGDLIYDTVGGSNGSSWSVYLLSGTTAGIGNTATAQADSAGLTTTADFSLVVSALYVDGPTVSGPPPTIPRPTADAPQTEDANEGWNPGREYGVLATGHQDGGTSGSSITASWTNPNTPTYTSAIVVAEFTAIPEASTAALLGLAGLGLLRRRR